VTKMMTAGLCYPDERHMKLDEIPVPEVADNEVLIRLRASGISTGTLVNWRILNRQPIWPTVIGIHGAGIVEEVGSTVFNHKPGDRVRVDPIVACGRCERCIADERLLCPDHFIIGFGATPLSSGIVQRVTPAFERYRQGVFAQYWRVPESAVETLPEQISFDVGSKLAQLAVSHAAMRLAGSGRGKTILLTGATGGSGTAAIKVAPLFGVEKVIAIGRDQGRLDDIAALEPGLVETVSTESLDPDWETTEGLNRAIRAITGGKGVDGLVDFMPDNLPVLRQAIYAMESGATAVLAGGNTGKLDVDYIRAMPMNQYNLQGLRGHNLHDMLEVRKGLISGRMNVDELITQTFPLERVNDAIDHLDSRTSSKSWLVTVHPNDA